MNIGILLYWEVHEFEAVACYSTLKTAQDLLPEAQLNVYTLARSRMSVKTAGGLPITPLYAFSGAPESTILIIPGGMGVDRAIKDRAIMSYLDQHLEHCQHIACIGTGAFILGELGHLRNQDVSRFVEPSERLEDYEVAESKANKVVKNARLWSAAARTGAIDLALALIQDHFPEVFKAVGKALYLDEPA